MDSKNEITFCLSTHNNLEYLKMAVYSVRKYSYYKDAPFIIYAENCRDGTNDWLRENKDKYDLDIYIENGNYVPRGIGGGINFAVDKAKTKYIMLLHSDFFVSKNWDKYCMETMKENGDSKLWISSFRIEPDIFENGVGYKPGTLVVNRGKFGEFYYNFNEHYFIKYAQQFSEKNKNKIIYKGQGVSGLIRKDDWDYIGGNDPLFSPASFEDMDLFLRMLCEGFDFILTPQSVVYHFGARGSHFPNDYFNNSSKRQKIAEQNNLYNWLKKWGKPLIKDERNDFISVSSYFRHRYFNLKEKKLHFNYKKKIKNEGK